MASFLMRCSFNRLVACRAVPRDGSTIDERERCYGASRRAERSRWVSMGGGTRGRRGGQVTVTCSPPVRRRAPQAVRPSAGATNAPASDTGPRWVGHSSRADGRGGSREPWTISGGGMCRTTGSASPHAADGPRDRRRNSVRRAVDRGPGPIGNSRVLSFGPLHSGGSRVHGAGDRGGEVRRAAAGLDGPARGGADPTGDGVWLDRAPGIRGRGRGRPHLPHSAVPGEAFERSRGTIVHEGGSVEHVCLCRPGFRGARRGAGVRAEHGRPAGPPLVVPGYRP